MCGVLVFDSVSRVPPGSSSRLLSHTIFHNHHLSHTTLSHAIFHTQLCHTPSFTHNFVTHYLSHTTLSHTIFHIQLCHTPSFTHNFVTHYLSHTTLSHTIFHIQLCHTPSFTYNFVTHHLSHTTLSHTIFHIQLCQPPSFTHNFVTHYLSRTTLSTTIFHIQLSHTILGHTPRHFAWQAWRKLTFAFVLRGRRGTNSHPPSFRVAGVALMALSGALGLGLVARDAAAFCVAGMAQSHIHLRFPWQAWDNLTSTFVLRGRRGIHGTLSSAWDGLVVSRGRCATVSHTIFHTQLCHTPSFAQLRRTPSFTHNFVTPLSTHTIFHYNSTLSLNFSILHHLLCLSFLPPATTFEAHYWKKLTCGVIRSLKFLDVNLL